jgi:urocanate hydratase
MMDLEIFMKAQTKYRWEPGDAAPTGPKLHTQGWQQEALLRMLLNNLDSKVAERPQDLVVYGGRGKAARSLADFYEIQGQLQELRSDETLLIQSGKALARIPGFTQSPRAVLANSHLVGKWSTWEHFDALEKAGLMMYGQMTAGSWIYIGSQGIVQGTYETFYSALQKHYNGNAVGKWIFSAGLGGMGGAQPLAAVLAGMSFLGVEVDASRAKFRLETGYLDLLFEDLDQAMEALKQSLKQGVPKSIGLVGNVAEILPLLLERADFTPSLVTDQTSAHDPLYGYIPEGFSPEKAAQWRLDRPKELVELAKTSIAKHVGCLLRCLDKGIPVFDYGNNIRAVAKEMGVQDAFKIPGFVPAYIRPLFCEGKGPFRVVALSGDPEDLHLMDKVFKETFREDSGVQRWLEHAPKRISIQGLPARILWLGYGQRAKAGHLLNQMVANGTLKAPIVIGRDHLDCGSVASPYRETEAMLDGSDAVADWPILNAFGNIVSGASWVSLHHGGGVGMGYSLHAGMVIVADGTPEATLKIDRVLNFDPGMGLLRHADAGYSRAKELTRDQLKADGLTHPISCLNN